MDVTRTRNPMGHPQVQRPNARWRSRRARNAMRTMGVGERKGVSSAETHRKRDVARYVELVKKMPDIRGDVVSRAKKRVRSGVYFRRASSRKTADKMLKE